MAALVLRVLFVVTTMYYSVRSCTGFWFNFSNFVGYRNYMTLTNGAVASSDAINLTTAGINWAVGRAFYNNPFPLWATAASGGMSRSSFSTCFTFRILNTTPTYYFGDGIAFFMTAYLLPASVGSAGGLFGLVTNAQRGSSSNKIVAVEFDAFLNPSLGDVDDNHVGIDVNDVYSTVYKSLSGRNIRLHLGTNLTAWVDYDGDSQTLSVDIGFEPFMRPDTPPLLRHAIDLSDYLPNNIYFGLSSGTGTHNAVHQILSWQFSGSPFPPIGVVAPSVPAPAPLAPAPPAPAPPIATSLAMSLSGAIKAGIALGGIFLFLLILIMIIYLVRRSQRESKSKMRMREWKLGDADLAQCAGPQRFTAKEIRTATKNFSDENFLGRGGFGPVYKGILPVVGTPVAVKSIGQNSMQGEKEFLAEVTIISRIRHKNLVQLQGWCYEKGQLFLVYDYMPKGSLDQHLFNRKDRVNVNPLDWSKRYKIVCGLAAGLVYLHEEWEKQVIHRDVKSANVMLDEEFNARLGDFGMARLVDHNMPHTTAVVGTLGYLAPEVAKTGKATSASDVYGFGVVALEVACGRASLDYDAPPNQIRLAEFVWEMYSKGALIKVVDPLLGNEYDKGEIERVLCLGLACSHPLPLSRPTMRQALDCLLNATPTPWIHTSKRTTVSSQPFFQPQLDISEVLSDTSTLTSTTTSTHSFPSSIASSSLRLPK